MEAQKMATTQELKEALSTALADQIGLYTFSDGQTTAAIRVDDGSEPYEEEPSVEGLEVVIVPALEVAVTPMLGGYKDTYTTLIVLKQFDIEETTLPCRTKVLEALCQFSELGIGQMRRVLRSNKLDNIETLTVQVSESVWVADGD
jgi:hypothetical protein